MIILRPENFGGIVFNTQNAHEAWVDKDLYGQLDNYFSQPNPEKNKEIEKIYKKLGIKNKEKIKILPGLKKINHSFPFTVLNSPELIDINITNKCNLNCPHCYIDSNSTKEEMTESDFDIILKECLANNILQVAIGGGEPTTHPLLPKFLKKLRKNNIVPNLTTNGKELSWKMVYYLAKYSGAVALSIEEWGKDFEKRRNFPFSQFLKSAKKLKYAGVNLVFQVVISKNNLDTLSATVRNLSALNPYGIIFLAYKPEGRGKNYDAPLSKASQDKVDKVLKEILENLKNKTKVGFDCCLTPALMDLEENSSFQGCSASRTSLAVMPNLQVLPCSFFPSEKKDNLTNKKLPDIWQGVYFNNFRNKIKNNMESQACSDCSLLNICLGACPILKLTNCQKTKNYSTKGS